MTLLNFQRHRASRGLSATSQLLVNFGAKTNPFIVVVEITFLLNNRSYRPVIALQNYLRLKLDQPHRLGESTVHYSHQSARPSSLFTVDLSRVTLDSQSPSLSIVTDSLHNCHWSNL